MWGRAVLGISCRVQGQGVMGWGSMHALTRCSHAWPATQRTACNRMLLRLTYCHQLLACLLCLLKLSLPCLRAAGALVMACASVAASVAVRDDLEKGYIFVGMHV